MREKDGFHKAASNALVNDTNLPDMDDPEEAIPMSLVPWPRDDDRARYLGLRSSGFGIRETLSLIAKAKSTLSMWRLNPEFVKLEAQIPEMRKTLALEYVGLEFLRNFRLILEKDYRVLKGSLSREVKHDDKGKPYMQAQDSQDHQYLLKMRAHYTPQQLQAIEELFGKGKGADEVNWVDMVTGVTKGIDIRAKETVREVKIETRTRQEPQLGKLEE